MDVACGPLRLNVSETGQWKTVCFRDRPVLFAGTEPDVEIHLGGEPRRNWRQVSFSRENAEQSVSMLQEYEIEMTGPSAAHRARLQHRIEILEGGRALRRSLRGRLIPDANLSASRYRIGDPSHRFGRKSVAVDNQGRVARVPVSSALLRLHGWTVSEGAGATLSVPMGRIPAGLAWDRVCARPRMLPAAASTEWGEDLTLTAPDGVVGAVVIQRPSPPLCVVVAPLPPRCPARTRVYGLDRLVIEHEFDCETWLTDAGEVEMACQLILFSEGDWRSVLPELGRWLDREGYGPPPDRAPWASNAVIWEVEPGFHGGFTRLREKLAAVRDIGFDTIYLMPWHVGGYATGDYERMNPALGTLDELRRFTDEVHHRGMRVLFDLLINVVANESSYPAQHPDWFYRDGTGQILRHPVWNGLCLDPASPGLTAFLTDYAVRCCREWGADGFRVDAAAHRGGLWNSPLGLPPHEHSYAVFPLLAHLRAAIRKVHPQAVFLAECFGPQQVPVSDCVGFQWVLWLVWISRRLLQRDVTGSELQRLLGEHALAMPPGTWVAGYTHTHDTLAFTRHDPAGPPIDMLFAWLALTTASVMVFGGGWGMPERPPSEQASMYRNLFQWKKILGGVATSDLSFPPMADPALLVAERPSTEGRIRVVANVSDEARPCGEGRRLYSWRDSPPGILVPWDVAVHKVAE